MNVDTRTVLPSDPMWRQVPLFEHLSAEDIRQLAAIAKFVDVERGDCIVQQGQTDQNLWVVLEGNCDVLQRTRDDQPLADQVRLANLEPYSSFGELSLFHPMPHSVSVQAQSRVKLLRINGADFDKLVEDRCHAAYRLAVNAVACIAARLRRMDQWVAQLVTHEHSNGQRGAEWSSFRDKVFGEWNL